MTPRRFPLPRSVEDIGADFVVKDSAVQNDEPGRVNAFAMAKSVYGRRQYKPTPSYAGII